MTSRKSATSGEESVVVGNPNVPNYRSKVNARKYYSMKKVLLKVFPIDVPGITRSEMMEKVASWAPKDLFPARPTCGGRRACNSIWSRSVSW